MPTITIPWPARELSPNARNHWHKKSVLARMQRQSTCVMAMQAGLTKEMFVQYDRLHVYLVFVPPDKRRRDADNLLASCKAALDGLSDAVGVDDSMFSIRFEIDKVRTVKGGRVEIHLEAA